ncbi:hypothetical protein [Actinophytocola sp.]|uniref:hypothetical protein n=1 Tax=Actinophytocola sp. TaxID=1872138 RepID=UPI003D6A60DD
MHELHIRQDGEDYYVGRVDTGEFVLLPEVGVRAIRLLRDGLSVDEAAYRLGEEVDLIDFADQLRELDYVAAVDDQAPPDRPTEKPTLPRLRREHVRWLLSPALALAVLALLLAGVIAVVHRPSVLPGYRDLVWSQHTGLVLVVNAAVGWMLVFLHELAHLATARAEGVPGWMRLGTRLQFLVVQTDVSGVWSAARPVRMAVYLSGVALELSIAAIGLLALSFSEPPAVVGGAISLVIVLIITSLPFEAMVFMRTDLYFVLQDLSRCPNLYAQGGSYVRYWLSRVIRQRRPDPTLDWMRRERLAVRWYAALLLVGTVCCLAAFVVLMLPATITLAGNAITGLGSSSAAAVIDSTATILVVVFFQILWIRAWLRRHGPRVAAWLHARFT